jgi:spore germination cell wall hydrolase CwlJ-like protein
MKHFITAVMLLFVTGPASAQNFELEKLFPQVQCMALNVYYEARGSNLADKAAVADVVLNRVNDTRYPDTVCDVVKQGLQDANGNMLRNKCQFSWYCDGKHDRPQDEDRWVEAQSIAWNMVEENKYRGITEGSTHYHATYVNPRWAKTLQLVGRIGAHIFYRWE